MRLEARRRAPVEALEVVEQGVLPEEARRRALEAELEVPLLVLRRLVLLVPLLPVPVPPRRRAVLVLDLPLELFLRPPLTLSMPSRSSHTSPTVPCTSNLPFLTTPYTILPQLDTAWIVVSSSQAFIPPYVPSLFLREGAPLRRLLVVLLDRVPDDLEPVDRLPVDLVPVVRFLDEEEELPRRVDELASSAPAPPTQSTSPEAAPPRMTCSLLSCVRRDRRCGAIFCKVLT